MGTVYSAERLSELRKAHGSLTAAARNLSVHPTTLQRAWKTAGLPPIGHDGLTDHERGESNSVRVDVDGDTATLTARGVERDVPIGEVSRMLRDRGLNPDDWQVDRVTVNEWDGPLAGGGVQTLRQLKASLTRRRTLAELGLIAPAALPPLDQLGSLRAPSRAGQLIVTTGCWQYPYADPVFEDLFLAFLRDAQPDGIIDLGDGMDFPSISRHRDNPAYAAAAQTCVNAYALALYKRRMAAPNAWQKILKGNHDDRLRNELLQRAERVATLKPASLPSDTATQDDVFSVRRLLRLDELGIELVETPDGGAYTHAYVEIAPGLLGVHGDATSPTSAALDTVRKHGCSVVMAHTHRQRLYSVRLPRGTGDEVDAVGIEIGCGCEIKGGLGYAIKPDWANGAYTFALDAEGGWHPEPIRYSRGVLRWRDQVWRA